MPSTPAAAGLRHAFTFDNRFVRELPGDPLPDVRPRQVHHALYSRVRPTPVAQPRLLAWSREVGALLGVDETMTADPLFADVFCGNTLLDGMEPYAANYGGHQFGQWAGQLGDGRAITLGEVVTGPPERGRDATPGNRWELQLKGSGLTPYSRSADGRAVLRSSIREFLCSEAMHHLGVPTTRALSLVATGEQVMRDMFYDGRAKPEPGAVVCRVAPSFIRFGHFELPSSRGDLPLLNQLIDFTISRDFPELSDDSRPRLLAEWFGQVCERTARMVAHWMRVGFVHGVMNTDNMSILGLTIDYGPYGWIDNFDLDWTPNTTDAGMRRYRFGHQAQIAYWNLNRLAEAILPAIGSTTALHEGLDRYADTYASATRASLALKLGLREFTDDDAALVERLFTILQAAEVDMTLFFRRLADASGDDWRASLLFGNACYDPEKAIRHDADLQQWLDDYRARLAHDSLAPDERRTRMNAVNPRFVLRNYLAQEAIDRAAQGDAAGITELLDVLRHPYEEQPGADRFAQRRPDWARNRAGCSMLSCSS